MPRLIENIHGPWIGLGLARNLELQKPHRSLIETRSRRIAALQWQYNQFQTSVTIQITPIHTMGRWFLRDLGVTPRLTRITGRFQPSYLAARFRIVGLPIMPDRQVHLAVTVDIVRSHAHVVVLGIWGRVDHMSLPTRVLQP